ncbi:MAG: SPFH domain-containing protein [Pirellulales bacterium]|nr:SPFH domain-containing protein [Pirellulales bacterium]
MSDFENSDPNVPPPISSAPPRRGGGGGFNLVGTVRAARRWGWGAWAAVGVILLSLTGWFVYSAFRITVPDKHIAVLIRKTGEDLPNHEEIAPSGDHKGIQIEVLTEGRYFYNPYSWDWEVIPMQEVPPGKLAVKVRLHGDDLPIGQFIAWEEGQKGIVPSVLRPGRYPINPYVEKLVLHDPVTIPAGHKGVVTHLSGEMPEVPNQLLVGAVPAQGVQQDGAVQGVQQDGAAQGAQQDTSDGHHELKVSANDQRGVHAKTLNPGTYYANPYLLRINTIDCRSQRYNLAENNDMGFPSKDGFWVSLHGIIEFRIMPDRAAEVFVTYNDADNDVLGQERLDEEIIRKIIMPKARSVCRLQGSNSTGRNFIDGETRVAFQNEFEKDMREACEPLGIQINQALITKIDPPQAIAGPVRDREIAKQTLSQYTEEIKRQEAEITLAVEQEKVKQRQEKITADQGVVKITVEAKRKQEVAITKANENLAVAQFKLDAAQDEAAAILARAKAEADVIVFQNEAEAAGWRRAVEALGDGESFARYVLFQKLAPGYRSIMTNTADSPLMEVFRTFLPEDQRTASPDTTESTSTEVKAPDEDGGPLP